MIRKQLIRLVTFLGGIYFFLGFILPAKFLGVEIDKYDQQISNGFIAIGAVALGLGLINILAAHGSRLLLKRRGWTNSLALLLGLFLMLIVSALDWRANLKISSESEKFFILRDYAARIEKDTRENSATKLAANLRNALLKEEVNAIRQASSSFLNNLDLKHIPSDLPAKQQIEKTVNELKDTLNKISTQTESLPVTPALAPQDLQVNLQLSALLGQAGVQWRELLTNLYNYSDLKQLYQLMYEGLAIALGSAMFALLGFYIASAAYRAFRLQSVESALMLGAAFLVMLGQIPFGLWISDSLPEIRLWILEIPNSAAFRAVKFGAAVAGLVMAFRMWLSIESESFGDKAE